MKQFVAGLALAFVVVASGCGGSQKPKTPAGPTCADVGANIEQMLVKAGSESGMDMSPLGSIAREVASERCTADKWSPEAIACTAKATAETSKDCDALLTPEQTKALEESMQARMEAMTDEEKAQMMKGMAPEGMPPDEGGGGDPCGADPCGGDE